MKFYTAVFLTFFALFAASLLAQDYRLAVSLQHRSMDWWYLAPENSSPFVQNINSGFCGEKLSLFAFAKTNKKGAYSCLYEISVVFPDKTSKVLVQNSEFSYESKSDNVSYFPLPNQADFTIPDQKGEYVFVLKIKGKDGNSTEYKSVFTVGDFGGENLNITRNRAIRLMYDYCAQPNPQALYAMFLSKKVAITQKGAPLGLNWLFMGFFKTAFSQQPILFEKLQNGLATFDEYEKTKAITLLAVSGITPNEKSLNENDKKAVNFIASCPFPDPYKIFAYEFAPAQIDWLFGEFYATGRYKTFLRIMDMLKNTQEGAYAESLLRAKSKPITDDDRKRFAIGAAYLECLRLVALNLDNDLFAKYLYKALKDGELERPVAMQIAVLLKTKRENKNAEKNAKVIEIKK